jgi:hypothetical protein
MSKRLEWKGLAEILGIIGVVTSLVFVAMEIRQNTDAIRSSTIQGVLDQAVSVNLVPVNNSGLREAIYAEPDQLTDDQRRMVAWFYTALLRVQLNRFGQAQVGFLDENSLRDLGGRGGVFQVPTFQAFWETQGGRYSPEFEQFMHEVVYGEAVDNSWFRGGSNDR